ncbi:uncharacterized protein K02A2.6-like [Topomyia yanbarensis]|uniref:uncharacterized protein K02A2.6-like n=1 Tax=Topomyia yanbarensis TaxID=2498891 RepID=UPI00273B12B3|nr:uncharacterized protein K02A2.6-like [Topomyia yanbarensis]
MPTLVVSDNGTQYTSAEFAEFCAMNGIQHVTSTPYHPQSNGQAERFVDTFKRAVKKIREGRSTINAALDTFLLTYRSTPNCSAPEGKSPSEVMFGRKLRTCLELLRPPAVCAPATESADNNKHRFFNRADPVFVQVHVRNSWRWASGVVVERIGTVMYNAWVEERRMLRSHINQMRSRAGLTPTVGQYPRQTSNPLPLDVLLEAWNLPQSPQVQPSSPSVSGSTTPTQMSLDKSTLWEPSIRASATPWRGSPPESESSSSSSLEASTSSSSSTFAPFNIIGSTSKAESEVGLPRRSSRTRRAPQWFDPYHLY